MDLRQRLQEGREAAVALRRWFHAHPEISMKEFGTAERIESELDRIGVVHRRVGETGVCGFLRGAMPGEVTVLRADIDALAVQDEKTAPYRSVHDGVAHACGHDMHAAALLSAAEALAAERGSLRGEIRFFFQQGEEVGGGAPVFIREGLLEGASRVMGIHAASDLPTGTVSIKPGASNASCDYFAAVIRGRGAHASTPHLGVDALYIASQAVVSLQAIVARQTDPLDAVLVGVGTLRAGTAYNAIAAEAFLEGTTRSFTAIERERVNGSVAKIIKDTAQLFGASAEVTFSGYSSPVVNDPAVCAEMAEAFKDMRNIRVVTDLSKRLGADDFAEYLLKAPGAYLFVGTRNEASPDTGSPHHNGHFDIDEDAIPLAAELYARYALRRNGSVPGSA